jgi:endonuclease YncB( thermonuclease family)
MYDLRDRIPADVQRTLGIAEEAPQDVAITTAPETGDTGDGTNGASTANQPEAAPTETPVETEVAQVEPSEVPAQQTDPTANIGGSTSELPPTNNAEDVTADPTVPVEPIETEIPTEEPVVPTEAPVEPTAVPTEIPVEPTAVPTEAPVEPTAVPTQEPTPIPTEEPTPEPTEVPTAEPTVAPTETPAEEPTVEPTVESTPEPTEELTPEPTEEPTVAPEPTLEPQEPSVLPETTPEQAVVANGFRFTLEGASVGDVVPELREINSVGGYGDWVVLSLYGQNMSTDAQVFDMSTFKLFADGQEVLVDVGNAWVSGLLGNTPAYGNTDAIQWAPGESHRFTLTFLAPPDAGALTLQAGDQTVDLSPALENPEPLLSEGTPVESDFIQATVVDVIDAGTIVIEVDGIRQNVRYLSIDAPTGDACYAAEATEANRSLVLGETVTLERQATDIDARGNWVRDVWVSNDAGQPVLVSQQLVLAGAAETDVSVPNTRFAGWLQSSQAAAQEAGAGIWGSCGE